MLPDRLLLERSISIIFVNQHNCKGMSPLKSLDLRNYRSRKKPQPTLLSTIFSSPRFGAFSALGNGGDCYGGAVPENGELHRIPNLGFVFAIEIVVLWTEIELVLIILSYLTLRVEAFPRRIVVTMSNVLCCKYGEDMNCCNSLPVLHNPEKSLLLITSKTNFQDKAEVFLSEKSSCRISFPGSDRELPVPCMLRKKIPVKETTSVKYTKHLNGKKMINEYVKEQEINRGSYGKVVLYRNISDGNPYALKKICKSRLRKVRVTQSETAMTNVLREVAVMKVLDHPNIVNLVEVIDDQRSDYLYMVLEYVEGNGINNISQTRGRIDEITARRYFKDIVAGLTYLHSHNIVHGDIKPENLLLTRSGRVKIGDFSACHAFEDDNDELWRYRGTPAFMAPECCLNKVYNGKAADIWAAGVTLHYMVVGCYPFLSDSLPETYNKIVNSPLILPEELDPELKDLLQGLLCKDPKQRITLDMVAEHPWITRGNSN
ncbi:hypothetical protein SLA2020_376190 [Shorea laevis]